MPDGVQLYWALAACSAIAAGYAVYRLFGSVARDRFVTDTPLVRIRSAAQGYARIEGHAARSGADVIAAPLSGRPCVWWDYRIAIKETDSRGNSHWSELERGTSVAPFTLSDQDGSCLIGPVGAEVTPTDSDTWYGDTPRPMVAPQHVWAGSMDHDYRYTERLLGAGTPLCVLGELRSHAEEHELATDARALLANWKADQPQLLARFDRDHDGRIDTQEWAAARAAAQSEAQATVANSRLERVNIVSQPTRGQPFLIAPLDGARLARRERRNGWLFLAAVAVFLGLTAWSLHKLRQEHDSAANPPVALP